MELSAARQAGSASRRWRCASRTGGRNPLQACRLLRLYRVLIGPMAAGGAPLGAQLASLCLRFVVFGVVAPPTSPSVCWLPRVRTPAGTDIHRIPFLEVVSDFQARLPLPSHVNSDFLITHSNKVIVDVHAKTAAFLTSSESHLPTRPPSPVLASSRYGCLKLRRHSPPPRLSQFRLVARALLYGAHCPSQLTRSRQISLIQHEPCTGHRDRNRNHNRTPRHRPSTDRPPLDNRHLEIKVPRWCQHRRLCRCGFRAGAGLSTHGEERSVNRSSYLPHALPMADFNFFTTEQARPRLHRGRLD